MNHMTYFTKNKSKSPIQFVEERKKDWINSPREIDIGGVEEGAEAEAHVYVLTKAAHASVVQTCNKIKFVFEPGADPTKPFFFYN